MHPMTLWSSQSSRAYRLMVPLCVRASDPEGPFREAHFQPHVTYITPTPTLGQMLKGPFAIARRHPVQMGYAEYRYHITRAVRRCPG